jgi:hypothetical protein
MSREKVEDFCEYERYDLHSPNGHLHQKPSAKGGKHLASRNPRVLCQKYGGACTMYYLVVPKVQETDTKLDSRAAEKGREEISK